MSGQAVQHEPILRAKIRAAGAPPQTVERARLLARLDPSAWQRVTLLCAPAGFGKTTLLAAWAQHSPGPVAWLTLDPGDNDLHRFLGYLLAAIRAAFPPSGAAAAALLEAPQALQPEAVIASLLNDLEALPAGGALVLDDAHTLQNPAVHAAIHHLVEYLPAGMRLVIASREDPPLPLARLRARGQLNELRGADLRFTQDEAARFLNQSMGLNLSAADVAALEARTEGWIAGLQLAALSMRERDDPAQFIQAFTGSHRFVLDYLVEEVLRGQPGEVQEFMLRTSILERLSGALCDALLPPGASDPGGQAMLARLEQSNLFLTPLDDERCWYRYHTLFADLLRYRLAQAYPDALPGLHRRAAAWLRENGFPAEAVAHLLSAGDSTEAAGLVEETCGRLLAAGRANRAAAWLDALPAGLFLTNPHLHLIYVWALIATSQFELAGPRLLEAERAVQLAYPGDDLPLKARGLMSEIKGTRAILASGAGDLEATIHLSNEALADGSLDDSMRSSLLIGLGVAYRLTGQSEPAIAVYRESARLSLALGHTAVELTALCNLGDLYQELGQLRQARAAYEEALASGPDSPILCMAHGGLADISYQRNQLDAAAESAARALPLAEQWGNQDILLATLCRQMRVHLALGQRDAGAGDLARIRAMVNEGKVSENVRGMAGIFEVGYWLTNGRPELAWQQAQALRPPTPPQVRSAGHAIAWAAAAVAWSLASGEVEPARQARELLVAYLPQAAAAGRNGYRVEGLATRALACAVLGDEPGALADLEQSLALGAPEGYLRVYIEMGPALMEMLRRLRPASPLAAYIDEILNAAPGQPAAPPPTPQARALVEPLSERELEVLALAAAGLSNSAIAARLVLAEGTIKRHLHNIFEKLDVASRAAAVVEARRLGLLG